jgi:probable addiction module antidote protein
MEKVTVSDWDLAEGIDDKEDVIVYLEGALADNDMEFLFDVIEALPRSEGMTEIARELGVTREALCASLVPEENPSIGTVVKMLDVLGLQLSVKPKVAA